MRIFSPDIISGLTLFSSTAYILILIPNLMGLDGIGAPSVVIFFGCALSLIFSSIFSGYYGKNPHFIAPGVAPAIITALYVQEHSLSWPSAFWILFFTGVVMVVISFSTDSKQKSMRLNLVSAIPDPLRKAIIGGIGALLCQKGLEAVAGGDNTFELKKYFVGYNENFILFFIGIFLIFVGFLIVRTSAKRYKQKGRNKKAEIIDLIGKSSIFLSSIVIIIIWLLFFKSGQPESNPPEISDQFIIFYGSLFTKEAINGAFSVQGLSLTLLLVYILIADIAGSPYEYLTRKHRFDQICDENKRRISKSMRIDSAGNAFFPLFGSTPIVYFAENYSTEIIRGEGPKVAYVAAFSFAIFSILLGVLIYVSGSFENLIPEIASAPALFFIGLYIISVSIIPDKEISRNPKHNEELLPVATTLIVTPIFGFDVGLSLGIAVYIAVVFYVEACNDSKDAACLTDGERFSGFFYLLSFIAFFALAVRLVTPTAL